MFGRRCPPVANGKMRFYVQLLIGDGFTPYEAILQGKIVLNRRTVADSAVTVHVVTSAASTTGYRKEIEWEGEFGTKSATCVAVDKLAQMMIHPLDKPLSL